MYATRYLLGIFLILVCTLPPLSMAQSAVPLGTATAPEQVIDNITSYGFQDSKIYYLNAPVCAPILNAERAQGVTTQRIGRTGVYGAVARTLFQAEHDMFCQTTQQDIISNVVNDENYIYWLSRSQNALVRLSEDALLGATPEIVTTHEPNPSELVLIGDFIYLLNRSSTSEGVLRINKNTGVASQLLTATQAGPSRNMFQTDGEYLYWRVYVDSKWALRKYQLATSGLSTIATEQVLSYTAYAGIYVYIGYENRIERYQHSTNTATTYYTYSGPNAARFISLAVDETNLYFIQSIFCSPSCSGANSVYRKPHTSSTASPLYVPPTVPAQNMIRLEVYGEYLYFLRNYDLVRLRRNADVWTPTNMRVSGLEITQAIQSDSQSVPLVRGKRTAVRAYVSSDGADIEAVTAHLYRVDGSGNILDGPLYPLSLASASAYMRIPGTPNKDDINQSFMFILPTDWIDDATLRVRVELNPHHYPPEPTYSDNELSSSLLTMNESGRLENHFVLFGYESGGTNYWPRYREDVLQTYSWVRRGYPVASATGDYSDPAAGFRPKTAWLFDADLGGNVDGSDLHAECQERINEGEDIANLCVAWYVVCPQLDTIRAAQELPNTIFQYGMVADDAGFPRGWACGLGTAGPSGSGTWGWDFDGSYADWYTAHEMGHGLGRGHPTPGGDDPATEAVEGCGHSRSDPSFPWAGAAIGDNTIRGFDLGDRGLNPALLQRVYPSSTWTDMMSYCANQWISDYTYNGIRGSIPALALHTNELRGGEFIQLSGVLFAEAEVADLAQVRHWSGSSFTPLGPEGTGDYRIRLLDNGGNELTSSLFEPEEGEYPDVYVISEWIAWIAGTARLELVHATTNTIYWSYDISPNLPTVSNVIAQINADRLDIEWQANDIDNDVLSYDILYSTDNGITWDMIAMNIHEPQASLPTNTLAGSSNAFVKVLAHDGFHQAEATSGVVNVPVQAPIITILEPYNNLLAAYGENIYFAAEVFDFQDGTLPTSSIEWRDQTGTLLGTGAQIDSAALPIGTNTVTIEATNSNGLSSTEQVTIIIDDELNLPEATLSAAPDQIGWHIGEGVDTIQTATIELRNVTTLHEFELTLNNEAPWLQATLSNSTTPATINLVADPQYLVAGTSLSTQLHITGMVNGSEQSVFVPISFAMGEISGPTATPARTYLPLVLR